MDDIFNAPSSQDVTAFPFFGDADITTALGNDGTVWFAAKDVFDVLGISWKGTGSSLPKCPENWTCTLKLRGQTQSRDVVFLSEPAVYRVLFRSNKPKADEFANWVCGTVLPAIRKHGAFGQITPAEEARLTSSMLAITRQLEQSKDKFVTRVLLQRLQRISQMLHAPMPDISELGSPVGQLRLGQS